MSAIYDIDGNVVISPETLPTAAALSQLPPVPIFTVNAMLKCAYTYIDACRSGALVYGDGTGTSQRAGTICCSTFMRQLLQGIPYNDYLPARADGTTKSGQRWRYGYRMIGGDYFESDSTYTALQMYNKYNSDGRAFPCDYNMVDAEPGDLIVFGANVSSIRHIGMFVFRDVMGNAYIMDSNISARNGNLAIRIHKAYDHTLADSNNPVGIIRPNLSEVYFEPSFETAQISDSAWSFTGENGFGYFVDLDYSVAANSQVTLDSENTFTPNYSGKDHRVLLIPATADGTLSGVFSGISAVVGKVSKFII